MSMNQLLESQLLQLFLAWWYGGMVACMVVWWHGGMVVWWHGGMVVWWYGESVVKRTRIAICVHKIVTYRYTYV